MSDTPPRDPLSSARGALPDVLVHAAVVGAACLFASLPALLVQSLLGRWDPGLLLDQAAGLLRWALLLGAGVAMAAWRRPSRSGPRAFAECLGLALLIIQLSLALWIGQGVTAEVTGRGGGGGPSASQLIPYAWQQLARPEFYANLLLLASALYLAAGRRRTRREGLALAAPLEAGQLVVYLVLVGRADPAAAAGFAVGAVVRVGLMTVGVPLLWWVADRLRPPPT